MRRARRRYNRSQPIAPVYLSCLFVRAGPVFHGFFGKCLIELGRYEEAEQQLITGVSLLEEALGAEHERTTMVINFLIDLYESWDVAETGKGFAERAAEWRAKLPKTDEAEPAKP